MQAGVYGIRCIPTNEIYVGSGISWRGRTKRHLANLRRGTSRHVRLQKCWNTHGETNFKIVLLAACWREGFVNFLADMGERPAGTSLDRYPDKTGNQYRAGRRAKREARLKVETNQLSERELVAGNQSASSD